MSVVRTQRIVVQGPRGKTGPAGPAGAAGIGSEASSVVSNGAKGNDVTDDTAAVQLAANSERDQVYFPPGTYKVGSVTFSKVGQTITFAPGAILKPTASSAIVFSGARQKIIGLEATIATASETTGSLVTVSGASSLVDGIKFNVDADVPNATLLKVTGNRVVVRNYKLVGAGKTFKYGIHTSTSVGGISDSVTIDGVDADVGDDGSSATYGGLVYLRSAYSQIKDPVLDSGVNASWPDGVLIIDGQKNTIHRPKIFAWNAKYAINRMLNSEFLDVFGGHLKGRNNSTYVTDSEGIHCAHVAGHLKAFNVSVTGFEQGIGVHGSHDTMTLVGCTIVNNKNYCVLIDAEVEGAPWGVRGITMTGCYMADQIGVGFIHFKSGLSEGVQIAGCEIGYEEVGIWVEDTFNTLEGLVVTGCRLQGGFQAATPVALCRPGLLSSALLFINNKTQSAGVLGTGTYASKAIDLMTAPVFTGATIGATGLKIGTDGNAVTKHLSQAYTANYAAGVAAGATVQLTFTLTGALTTDSCHVTLTTSHATSGLIYTPYVTTTNEVGLRAFNPTASPIGVTTGGVRFDIFRH